MQQNHEKFQQFLLSYSNINWHWRNITWTPPTAATVQTTAHNSWQLGDIFLFYSSHVMLIPYKSFNILSTRSSIIGIGINILFYIRSKPRLEKNPCYYQLNMPRNLRYPPLFLNVNKICWFGIKTLSGIIIFWWFPSWHFFSVASIISPSNISIIIFLHLTSLRCTFFPTSYLVSENEIGHTADIPIRHNVNFCQSGYVPNW